MKKILKIGIVVMISIPVLIWSVKQFLQWGWERGTLDRDIQVVPYKSIVIENKLDSVDLLIDINFEYTNEDSLSYQGITFDSLAIYNKKDSIYSISKTNVQFFLPILQTDSTAFPRCFYMKIYNQKNSELLKEYNYDSFIKIASSEHKMNEKNPLTAQQWTLIIDSTLLDLKK